MNISYNTEEGMDYSYRTCHTNQPFIEDAWMQSKMAAEIIYVYMRADIRNWLIFGIPIFYESLRRINALPKSTCLPPKMASFSTHADLCINTSNPESMRFKFVSIGVICQKKELIR
jgi:hypothetical protein